MFRKWKLIGFLFCFAGTAQQVAAQHIEMLQGGRRSSLRGLSAVNDKVIWVSGSGGNIARSTDGGANWNWTTVPGFEKREFRDIEAFDAETAIAIAIDRPAQIVKTTDGGQSWSIVFTDSAEGVFLDAMDFADRQHGIIVGDPLPGSHQIYCLFTADQGASWTKKDLFASVATGEAMFAASGTNIIFPRYSADWSKTGICVITGGSNSSLLKLTEPQKTTLPLQQGRESTGANGMDQWNGKWWTIVGGDFANDRDTTGNCIYSSDAGRTWTRPEVPPHGYRSSVAYARAKWLVACGTSGVDVSMDGGKTWSLVTFDGFHVCRKAKKGNSIFLAGSNGRIARLVW